MKWLKTYFVDKYVIDPNGFFLIEYKNTEAYPTYKSILTVADYVQKGQSLEYIIFEPVTIKEENKEDYCYHYHYHDKSDHFFLSFLFYFHFMDGKDASSVKFN